MPGCGVPVTVRKGKSYKINPQLDSVVASLCVIRETINGAKPGWWRATSLSQTSLASATAGDGDCVEEAVDLQHQDEEMADDDSEATMLEDDNEFDDLGSPVLKRRKKEESINSNATTNQTVEKESNEAEKAAAKESLPTVSEVPASKPKPAVQMTHQLQRNHTDDGSIATQPYDINKPSQEIATDDDEGGLFSDNHTPQELDQSCALPDNSFHVSPIAMGDSQSQRSPFGRRMAILNDITEEMEGMGGTTEEVDMEDTETEHEEMNSEGIGHEHNQVQARVNPSVKNAKSPKALKDIQDNVPIQEQKPPAVKLAPKSAQQLSATKKSSRTSGPQIATEVIAAVKPSSVAATTTSAKSAPEQETIENKEPPVPRVFLISPSTTLVAADQRCVRKFIKNERLQMLQPEGNDVDLDFGFNFDSEEDVRAFLSALYKIDSTSHVPAEYSYAICSNAEYQTFEGYIMPRSFRYVLAVACGLSIIDFSYLRKATSASFGIHDSRKYLYAPGAFQIDDGAASKGRKRSRGRESEEKEENYQVAGDVDSADLMGPQRSRKALMESLGQVSDCNYNNGLLSEYTVLLFGEFDQVPKSWSSIETESGQKRRKSSAKNAVADTTKDTDDNVYTKGRTKLLLRLCGASVVDMSDFKSTDSSSGQSTMIILTRNKSDSKISKLVRAALKETGVSDEMMKSTPIVSCKWLEDSIAGFKVKNVREYS